MNIFFLDFNPQKAAEYHCDKHVVKMIIETAQMLYSAHWALAPEHLPVGCYRNAHSKHPCSIWVRTSLANYKWLCELGMELCREYTYRYEKTHKTQAHIEWLIEHPPRPLQGDTITELPQAMPHQYKHANPVTAYQTYYIESKYRERGIVKYTRRSMPPFFD
jgi:hypothetical protein